MEWQDIKKRQFVTVHFIDHCEIFCGDVEDTPANYDGSLDDGELLAVTVRGQVSRVTDEMLEVEGAWESPLMTYYGVYRIARGTITAVLLNDCLANKRWLK